MIILFIKDMKNLYKRLICPKKLIQNSVIASLPSMFMAESCI